MNLGPIANLAASLAPVHLHAASLVAATTIVVVIFATRCNLVALSSRSRVAFATFVAGEVPAVALLVVRAVRAVHRVSLRAAARASIAPRTAATVSLRAAHTGATASRGASTVLSTASSTVSNALSNASWIASSVSCHARRLEQIAFVSTARAQLFLLVFLQFSSAQGSTSSMNSIMKLHGMGHVCPSTRRRRSS